MLQVSFWFGSTVLKLIIINYKKLWYRMLTFWLFLSRLLLPRQSSILVLYKPILLHLLGSFDVNMEKQLFSYCPPEEANTRSIFFEIDDSCIMTRVKIYSEINPLSCHNTDTVFFVYTWSYNIMVQYGQNQI